MLQSYLWPLGILSFNLGSVITCHCPTGFLFPIGREWPVTFKYAMEVSPFISVSDDLSLGRLRRL